MIKIEADGGKGKVLIDGEVSDIAEELNNAIVEISKICPDVVKGLFISLVDIFGEKECRRSLEIAIKSCKTIDNLQKSADPLEDLISSLASDIIKQIKCEKERKNEHNNHSGTNYKKTRGKNNQHWKGNV